MNRRIVALVLGAIAAQSCAMGDAGLGDVGASKDALVICPTGPTIEGIDVSHWQGTIAWDAVAADGIDFAFIRVSHGTSTLDREFARNWPEAERVGVIRGVYQFFSAANDPTAQADLLVDSIGGALAPGDLPPVLDVEGMSLDGLPAATVIANMRTWIARIRERLGVTPIIYTAKYFWQDQLGNPDFTEHPLWAAHYGVTCPDAPTPWTGWEFWQYTSTGSVAGITGNCDRNIFNGTLTDLLSFTGATPVCGDGWCTGGESPTSCAADCPVCATVPPLGRDVDESEICFEGGGNPTFLRQEAAGWLDTLIWTHATDSGGKANFGVWHLTFDEAGSYQIEVHTPAPWSESMRARYLVHHDGVDNSFTIDQTGQDGWQLLGDARFAAGGDQWVRLNDNTGEPLSTNTQLVYDAIRLTRLDPPATPDGGVMPTVDGGVPPTGDGGSIADGGFADGGRRPLGGGCSCRASAPTPGAPLGWVFGLIGLAWLRRRALR